MNLDDLFRESVRRQPDHAAVCGPKSDDRWSYRDLDRAIDAAAGRLQAAGVRPGHCVGLHVPSGVSYIVCTYAAWRCGACVVPMPTELTSVEKADIAARIALDALITDRRQGAAGRTQGLPIPAASGAAPVAPDIDAVLVHAGRDHPAGFRDIDSAFIRFTSGTTGASKGVVLSHTTIAERVRAANDVLSVGPGDRVVWVLSMAYHFAVTIVGYLSVGATIVLPSNTFAGGIFDAASRYGATMIYGSPVHYAWLAAYDDAVPLSDLRLAVSTTAALDRRTADGFRARYGLPVTQALGIIEVGLPFINTAAAERPLSVGRLLPAYRLRMVDVGLGGDVKEIHLSGPGFLDAYYHPWQPRAAVMPDGWFRTGDVGTLDADGFLTLRGRTTDVISVLGKKFFPQEVEAVLAVHPGVAAAGVFARPDGRFGEVPHARVVPRGNGPTEAELINFCRERLAEFKVPHRIIFVAALPRTASGKLLHRAAN
jgi:long-chain acyl-CoA synthetase